MIIGIGTVAAIVTIGYLIICYWALSKYECCGTCDGEHEDENRN